MDVCVEMYLTIGLLYFLQTLTCIQGQHTYVFLGCFGDGVVRALPELIYNGADNSIEHCVTLCGQSGYKYAGLQARTYCYCGNSGYDRYGESAVCQATCAGDTNQICGGHYSNSVYEVDMVSTNTESSTPLNPTTAATYADTMSHSSATSQVSASMSSNDGSKSPDSGDQTNIGIYIGAGMGAVVVCAIIVLVVVLVICRRKNAQHIPSEPRSKSLKNNSYSTQTTKPRTLSEAPSISQNIDGSSTSNPAASKHHVTANGDVYTLVNKVKPLQVAADAVARVHSSSDEPEEDAIYMNNIDDSDVYCNTVSAVHGNKQSADSNSQSHQVYDIAEPLNDDLEMVDSEIYGLG